MKELDFLPDLPKPNLDDREFRDLIEECIARIPRYCPEWTNHNPSDPGITLIELFAWLTHQMLVRFNQVPFRNYIVFLELLGIRLQPPVPARTNLTFYITKVRPGVVKIPARTEVATERDENKEEIVFTTDRDVIISNPVVKHFLTARTDLEPSRATLNDYSPISKEERKITPQQWWQIGEIEDVLLFEESKPGNCFYLVLDDDETENTLPGNVISIVFRGEAARATGINPEDPPIAWEAWNGKEWQSNILKHKKDDKTRGFSFGGGEKPEFNPIKEGAEVILHLPLHLQRTSLGTEYNGYWIRCRYSIPDRRQPGYTSSPAIIGLSIRTIGGAVRATQCTQMKSEFLGVSNGRAGQNFQLQETPVIQRERELGEYIEVRIPGKEAEIWQEVENFADSTGEDPHYTIDSRTGIVQFGPLIAEPAALKKKTQQWLQARQPLSSEKTVRWEYNRPGEGTLNELTSNQTILERQYGKIPPLGAEIYMLGYRTGGGSKGNLKAGTLHVLKASIPYLKSATNYEPARGGIDAESLTDAVLKVPRILRDRESAVTPSDFENIALKSHRKVARAHCLTDKENNTPGVVRLSIVPKVDADPIDFCSQFIKGMKPTEHFTIDAELEQEIRAYMQERKPLGIQVKLEEPEYIGVKVETEVVLEPGYNNLEDQRGIHRQLLAALYRFLNPLTGGIEGKGWPLGRPLYPSDIVSLCRSVSGVRDLGNVKLFKVSRDNLGWFCSENSQPEIVPGNRGIICSWEDEDETLLSGHVLHFEK